MRRRRSSRSTLEHRIKVYADDIHVHGWSCEGFGGSLAVRGVAVCDVFWLAEALSTASMQLIMRIREGVLFEGCARASVVRYMHPNCAAGRNDARCSGLLGVHHEDVCG